MSQSVAPKESEDSSRLTQELPDGALITQILLERLVLHGRHGSEHADTVAHLSLLPATASAAVETVTPPTGGVWKKGMKISDVNEHYCFKNLYL